MYLHGAPHRIIRYGGRPCGPNVFHSQGMFDSPAGIPLNDFSGKRLAEWVDVYVLRLLVFLCEEARDMGRESCMKELPQPLLKGDLGVSAVQGFALKVNLETSERITKRR
jgi:hypothetical protein